MAWIVKFFQTARGDYPVKDFIEKQDKTTIDKFIHSVELLENYGPFIKPPYSKKLYTNLYELRISGKIAVRIFYTLYNGEYYLLHAIKKKTQKTPIQDIKTALDRKGKLI